VDCVFVCVRVSVEEMEIDADADCVADIEADSV